MNNPKGYKIIDQHATYFVTFSVVGWVDIFIRKECKDIVIQSLKYCQEKKGLIVHSFVIMGSHIHLILTAKESSDGLSAIIRDMKKFIANSLIKWIFESGKESRKEWLEVVLKYHAKFNSNNFKYQVWQQNNHPKILIHPKFTMQKVDYIHNNPVVAGIVDKAEDYRYSSARNYSNRDDTVLDISIIDYGIDIGYVPVV